MTDPLDPHALTLGPELALVSEPAPDPVRRPRNELEARVLLAQLDAPEPAQRSLF